MIGFCFIFFSGNCKAALPVLPLKKYNLLLLTAECLTILTETKLGISTGKIFSTPIAPAAIRRTVNVFSLCSPFIAITIPEKFWILSFSPSRIFCPTITLSPICTLVPQIIVCKDIYSLEHGNIGTNILMFKCSHAQMFSCFSVIITGLKEFQKHRVRF